ncbi:MAG: type II toxin-antitoxin system HicA family toxin [Actinomycetota bacterium]|nr:type II toxin-antitoxin system HicA family toxin [Actinomycetota bacterium]
MRPALPVVSGVTVVAALAALAEVGYEEVSQRGSHVKLRRDERTVIVPLHRELAPGTLRSILRQASLTPAEFIALL